MTWRVPSQRGRNPITDYVVEYTTGGGVWMIVDDGASDSRQAVVEGLEPRPRYRFRVTGVSLAGTGLISAHSNSVTIRAG